MVEEINGMHASYLKGRVLCLGGKNLRGRWNLVKL